MFDERNDDEEYDFGGVTISLEGREFMLDIVQTVWDETSGDIEIECGLEIDKDTFPDCKYDIQSFDLMLGKPKIEVYVGGTFSNIIDYMTLFVKGDNGEGTTRALDVIQE